MIRVVVLRLIQHNIGHYHSCLGRRYLFLSLLSPVHNSEKDYYYYVLCSQKFETGEPDMSTKVPAGITNYTRGEIIRRSHLAQV